MKKKLHVTIGILALILSACASNATLTPFASESAPEVLAPTMELSAAKAPAASSSFANDVMPILKNSCTNCHGVDQVRGGLDIASYDNLMAGSFNGEVIIPGNAGKSLLIDMVTSGKMPKRGPKLTAGQIQIITDWINAGAPNN